MENEHVHHAKKIFDENNLDVAEKKLDQHMEKLMHMGRLGKCMNMKWLKSILASHAVNDINEKIAPYLRTIFIVLGWISVVTGIIGIFSFLVSLSGLGFAFSFGFGVGIRVIIYILLAVLFSLISLVSGIGMIKFKKRVLALVALGFIVTLITFIISLLPSGFYVSSSYGSLGSSFLDLILSFILVLLVLKNKELFHN